MENESISCPICRRSSTKLLPNPGFNFHNGLCYDCPTCGRYNLERHLEKILQSREVDPRVSAWIRQQNPQRNDEIPTLTIQNLEEVIANLRSYSVSEKQLLLLRYIESKTEYPGKPVQLNLIDEYPVVWAARPEEMNFLIRGLFERKLLNGVAADAFMFITPEGWDLLDASRKKGVLSKQAFVAMAFKAELNDAYKFGIQKGIERAGYTALRIDKEEHVEMIDAKIVTDIKDSAFVVADVTYQNQGVYFEAGYALGLGQSVIWSVREDEIKKVHFDTRQYNHIVWNSPEQLAESLYYRICAVVGKAS